MFVSRRPIPGVVAVALLLAAPVALAQSYPRVTGSGENYEVDYGPMARGNIVGGGRVMISRNDSMNLDVVHLDMMFAQQPRPGYVPLTIGSGDGQETIWVPAAAAQMMRNARASMPPR